MRPGEAVFLLDVNVLIALGDPHHVHHLKVADWFTRHRTTGWATCPLTENGYLRILGHPKYPDGPGSPQAARLLLKQQVAEPGHQFWPDSFSLVDVAAYPTLPGSKALTDYYLLGLALSHSARLATLDRRIDPSLIPGGPNAFALIVEG